MLEKNSDREVHVEKIEQRPTASIAFGLERIGLIAVQAPILSCIILVGLIIGAIFGIERIKIDDSLSQLFRSNSREYRQYESETKRFRAVEFDVLVVVEGKTLLARDNLEKLRDFVTDLQLVEGTRGLISLFSARQAPARGKLPAALFPSELPQGADYDKFIETVKTNEIIRGKLLSEDATPARTVVISFSDSMQLTFAARARLIAGQDKYTAFRNAVLVVGPACVLTHGTAGISFIALQFSDSDLIRKFGEAGLAATIIALIAVLSLVPVFGVLFVRNEKVFAVKFRNAY